VGVARFYAGWRFTTHDAYHRAEIGQTLGMNGLEEVDV
jgi:hypothetical protein